MSAATFITKTGRLRNVEEEEPNRDRSRLRNTATKKELIMMINNDGLMPSAYAVTAEKVAGGIDSVMAERYNQPNSRQICWNPDGCQARMQGRAIALNFAIPSYIALRMRLVRIKDNIHSPRTYHLLTPTIILQWSNRFPACISGTVFRGYSIPVTRAQATVTASRYAPQYNVTSPK
jgi:hypothetical protein